MTTRKLLVAFDPRKPEKRSSDFLVVTFENEEPILFGIKSKRRAFYGLMIFLGKEVNENDLFAKLVDTGRKIENAQEALQVLEYYIQQLQEYRIGNVLNLEAATSGAIGFKLSKTAETPLSANQSKLP